MSLLQGFEEVHVSAPVGKVTLTVTASVLRFNKATAAALGYPAYVKLLVDDKTRRIAIQAASGRESNVVKFSKPEGKQTSSISIKESSLVSAVAGFFDMPQTGDDEIAFQSITGTAYVDDKVIIFAVDDAASGVMKRRGRKKSE